MSDLIIKNARLANRKGLVNISMKDAHIKSIDDTVDNATTDSNAIKTPDVEATAPKTT